LDDVPLLPSTKPTTLRRHVARADDDDVLNVGRVASADHPGRRSEERDE
jgi:hypothetical protein